MNQSFQCSKRLPLKNVPSTATILGKIIILSEPSKERSPGKRTLFQHFILGFNHFAGKESLFYSLIFKCSGILRQLLCSLIGPYIFKNCNVSAKLSEIFELVGKNHLRYVSRLQKWLEFSLVTCIRRTKY